MLIINEIQKDSLFSGLSFFGLLNLVLKPKYFTGFNYDLCLKSLVIMGVVSEFVSRVGIRDKFLRK